MSDQLKRYEFRGEYDMIHLAEVATGESLSGSYDIEWVRADEAAAALAEAQAEIARLRGALTYIGLHAGTSVLNANGAAQMAREAALRSAHDEG